MSAETNRIKSAPLPREMERLPKDRRGYPIPVLVLRDTDGRPHFTINDERTRHRLLHEDRCGICGGKLLRGRWFVGGPASALDPKGAYFDPPMHRGCAVYALQVCPWLAAPHYERTIEARTLNPDKMPTGMVGLIDRTQIPDRPVLFVAVMAIGTLTNREDGPLIEYIRPKRPYRAVEFWRAGQRLPEDDADVISIREKYT